MTRRSTCFARPRRRWPAGKPVLLTVNEAGTREAAALAKRAAKAGADGLMVVPSPIYHTNPRGDRRDADAPSPRPATCR